MIAKGNTHDSGPKLVAYLLTAQEGERIEFGGARGFEQFGGDLLQAAAIMQEMADATTNCKNAWFHTQTRLAPGEGLSGGQWQEVLEREEKRLGFTGHARVWSFHIQENGDRHLHAAWFRVDPETNRAHDPGLYKLRLKELARTLEKEFALREVSNHRKPEDRARIADRKEVEESRRLGTDVRAIRTAILDCFEQSDSGKAFNAALDAQGLMLANGDRRDCFVVIDEAGGQHALNKKLTGQTLAQTRDRLADLDRSQLPGVEQAQAMQAERHHAPEPEVEKHPEGGIPTYRPPSENAPAATAARQNVAQEPETAKTEEKRPLGKTAAQIHAAWNETRNPADLAASAAAFVAAIEDRGPILVYVTADEAKASERARAFAKAIERQNRAVKEGFAVVDERGTVTRIDQRVTGDLWQEIEQRLASIDRAGLLTVAEARDVMKEANRAEWQQQKEAERAEARRDAPVSGTAAEIRLAWALSQTASQLEDALAVHGVSLAQVSPDEAYASEQRAALAKEAGRFAPVLREGEIVAVDGRGSVYRLDERTTGDERGEIEGRLVGVDRAALMNVADTQEAMRAASLAAWKDERRAEREQARPASPLEAAIADALAASMTGTDFAAALDDKGLTIARATAFDVLELDALREVDRAAGTFDELASGRRFADLIEGDFAIVTRQGDVFRLSPQKLDFEEIEQRLADVQTHMPSVVEARATSKTNRERKAEQRAQSEADFIAARIEQADAFAGKQELRQATRAAETVVHAAFETPVAAAAEAVNVAGLSAARRRSYPPSGISWAGCSAGRRIPKLKPSRNRRRQRTRKLCTPAITPRQCRPKRRNLTTGCTRRKPASRNRI